jgi:hypothetical protein
VQATRKELDVQLIHIWDIADGNVVELHQYTDTWQVAQAAGETPLTFIEPRSRRPDHGASSASGATSMLVMAALLVGSGS